MIDISKEILEAIETNDPQAFGDINVSNQSSNCTVTGRLHTSLEKKTVVKMIQDIMQKHDSSRSVFVSLDMPRRGLRVKNQTGKVITEATNRRRETKPLDEIEIIYSGMVDTSALKLNNKYKRVNHETFQKLLNIVRTLGVIFPIIVDKNYNVIDGNLRLDIAKLEKIKEVPVLVLNDDGIRSDFLRMSSNRISEFQRWLWNEVDEFVDSVPQAQPLLEPLGFFGDKILPTTYFANTIMNYEIDEFNGQQKQYSQDIGLAKWAEMRRKQIAREENKKQAKKTAKIDKKNSVSLFDLQPKKEDFLETYDAKAEIRKDTLEKQKLAGEITEAYDKKRNAEMEEKGKIWQNTRRTSQQLAKDKRAEAESKSKKKKKD